MFELDLLLSTPNSGLCQRGHHLGIVSYPPCCIVVLISVVNDVRSVCFWAQSFNLMCVFV